MIDKLPDVVAALSADGITATLHIYNGFEEEYIISFPEQLVEMKDNGYMLVRQQSIRLLLDPEQYAWAPTGQGDFEVWEDPSGFHDDTVEQIYDALFDVLRVEFREE